MLHELFTIVSLYTQLTDAVPAPQPSTFVEYDVSSRQQKRQLVLKELNQGKLLILTKIRMARLSCWVTD